jgi:glycosyltransferase involved in cell wall biosynthesis
VDKKRQYLLNFFLSFFNLLRVAIFFLGHKEKKPQIIFANGGKIYPQAVILSIILGRPVILATHLIYNNLMQKILFWSVKNLRQIYLLFVSYSVAKKFNEVNRIGFKHEAYKKIFIQENSLSEKESLLTFDEKKFTKTTATLNKSIKKSAKSKMIKDARIHLAVVGRIHPEKGQDLIFDIIDLPQYKNWQFTFIGSHAFSEADYFHLLKDRLQDKVVFLGEVEHIPTFLKNLKVHIVIMPSRVPESFGLVAIEAMAASCFTLVSNKGELPHIAKKTGAVVFNDRKKFAEKMNDISALSMDELRDCSKKMHGNTIHFYPFHKYRDNIKAIIYFFTNPGKITVK